MLRQAFTHLIQLPLLHLVISCAILNGIPRTPIVLLKSSVLEVSLGLCHDERYTLKIQLPAW